MYLQKSVVKEKFVINDIKRTFMIGVFIQILLREIRTHGH